MAQRHLGLWVPHFLIKLTAIFENQRCLACILPGPHFEEEAIQVMALEVVGGCQILSHLWFILWNPCSDLNGSDMSNWLSGFMVCSNNEEEKWSRMHCPYQETEEKSCRACPKPQLYVWWWTSLLCQSCSKRYACLCSLEATGPLVTWIPGAWIGQNTVHCPLRKIRQIL